MDYLLFLMKWSLQDKILIMVSNHLMQSMIYIYIRNFLALWQSYLIKQVGNRWSEAGNITFSEGNTVIFESNELSGIQQGNFSDLQYGAVSKFPNKSV